MDGADAAVIVAYNLLAPGAAERWHALLPRRAAPHTSPPDDAAAGVEESKSGSCEPGDDTAAAQVVARASGGVAAEEEEASAIDAAMAAALTMDAGGGGHATVPGSAPVPAPAAVAAPPAPVATTYVVGELPEHVALRKTRNETALADMCADVICLQGWDAATNEVPAGFKRTTAQSPALPAQIFVREDMPDVKGMPLVGDVPLKEGALAPPCVACGLVTPTIAIVNVHLPYDGRQAALAPPAAAARKKTKHAGLQTVLHFAATHASSGATSVPTIVVIAADDPEELQAPLLAELLRKFRFVAASTSRAWKQNTLTADGTGAAQGTAVFVRAEGFPAPAAAPRRPKEPLADHAAETAKHAAETAKQTPARTVQRDYIHITPLGSPQNPWTDTAMLGSTHVPLILEPLAFYAAHQ